MPPELQQWYKLFGDRAETQRVPLAGTAVRNGLLARDFSVDTPSSTRSGRVAKERLAAKRHVSETSLAGSHLVSLRLRGRTSASAWRAGSPGNFTRCPKCRNAHERAGGDGRCLSEKA